MQRKIETEEETHGKRLYDLILYIDSCNIRNTKETASCIFQGVSTKANSSEVEIIRYQVLIPVTEVQVRASSAKDMESHFLWELIHLRSQLQRRSEKVYVLSNRYFLSYYFD